MKRRRLAELVREEAEGLKEPPPAAPAPPPGPRYLTYVRKECRLREDQLDALTQLARRLSRARRARGPRITENTLIRLAVDRLLAEARAQGVEGLLERLDEGA